MSNFPAPTYIERHNLQDLIRLAKAGDAEAQKVLNEEHSLLVYTQEEIDVLNHALKHYPDMPFLKSFRRGKEAFEQAWKWNKLKNEGGYVGYFYTMVHPE